jgi:hypothetical protein
MGQRASAMLAEKVGAIDRKRNGKVRTKSNAKGSRQVHREM